MRRLAVFVTVLLALWLPSLSWAQTGPENEQDDRGYLQAFLEDNLSDAGREVRIVGFVGALSARATIEELTIADDDGIWLTLRGAVLDWNRSALLRGRLEITELSALEILIPRRPNTTTGPSGPEASGFSLPELPVSIDIASITAAKVVLGEALLGEAAEVSLQGSANLAEGAGQSDLVIERIDDAAGTLRLHGSYSNETRDLALSLSLSEGANGIAANLIGLPGRPALDLQIEGAGPVDDFTADINLATDGEKRLKGQIALSNAPAEDAAAGPGQRIFTADIGGDIAPVFLPEYRAFFGQDVRLILTGRWFDNGRMQIDELDLTTDAMQVAGQLALGPNGWPERFSLTGSIAAKAGDAVLLPLAGPRTQIRRATLSLEYDAASGDEWVGALVAERLVREDYTLEKARITGSGTLVQGDGASVGQVMGDAKLTLRGIAPRNKDLATAIGPTITGGLSFDWTEDAPLHLSTLSLSGIDYGLTGVVTLKGLRDRLNLKADGNVELAASDMSRFSGVAGMALSGAANLTAVGRLEPLGGGFDAQVQGTGTDLGIGQPQVDPLLAGISTLTLIAKRDQTGTVIERFEIASDHANAVASGEFKTGASAVRFEAQINDAAMVAPGLDGLATLGGRAQQSGTEWAVDMDATGPGGTVASVQGMVTVAQAQIGRMAGVLMLHAKSLVPYSQIAGQSLSGSVEVKVDGWIDPRDGTFDASVAGNGQSIGVGQPELDRLLRGQNTLAASLHRDTGKATTLDSMELFTPEITASVTGATNAGNTILRFTSALRDLGLFIPGLNGPVSADGTAELTGQSWQIDARGTGPGGTAARVTGRVDADGGGVNLAVAGTAPLALANLYLRPNQASGQASFDLSVAGPVAISSLSGTVRTDAARLALPIQRLSFEAITASVRLAGGRATLDASGSASTSGRFSLSGPISLSPPFNADLAIRLTGVGVTDAALYQSTVGGRATVQGPLSGGARIGADLTLGATELRVPESGRGSVPVMSGLQHRNEPANVHLTRSRAGQLDSDRARAGGAAAYPIDILLRAPARIFVRGRGLDAELGGQLHLTGTTANVIPNGRFDLIRGRLDILGRRLTLSEGFASLQGGFDPFLKLVAETRSAETDIRIVVEGLASAPVVTFTSSPDLPEDEVLSRLLFGRGLTRISPLQALQLASAVNTLAGGSGAGIVGQLRESFGLDDLDVTTGEGGETGARIGKYITENIYSDVTVGSDGSSEINLNLTVSPSLTARGSLASDGDSSLGLYFERDY